MQWQKSKFSVSIYIIARINNIMQCIYDVCLLDEKHAQWNVWHACLILILEKSQSKHCIQYVQCSDLTTLEMRYKTFTLKKIYRKSTLQDWCHDSKLHDCLSLSFTMMPCGGSLSLCFTYALWWFQSWIFDRHKNCTSVMDHLIIFHV